MGGLAFERVCLQHIEQIKKALGFGAVISIAHAWPRKEAQIDLLIDRNDDTINISPDLDYVLWCYSKLKY